MVKSGQIDADAVNVVFVGMHGESTATNRRLLSGCNDCGLVERSLHTTVYSFSLAVWRSLS